MRVASGGKRSRRGRRGRRRERDHGWDRGPRANGRHGRRCGASAGPARASQGPGRLRGRGRRLRRPAYLRGGAACQPDPPPGVVVSPRASAVRATPTPPGRTRATATSGLWPRRGTFRLLRSLPPRGIASRWDGSGPPTTEGAAWARPQPASIDTSSAPRSRRFRARCLQPLAIRRSHARFGSMHQRHAPDMAPLPSRQLQSE